MIEQFYLTNSWDPTNTTNQGQSQPGGNGNEVIHILETLWLESHYQMQFSFIRKTLLHRCSPRILQPQP